MTETIAGITVPDTALVRDVTQLIRDTEDDLLNGSGGSPALAACRRAGEDGPARLTDRQLLEQVTSRQARCVGAAVDPDAWFPVATRWQRARAEAAPALALCAACPVRAECLELSMRQWGEAGRYGVWGGLLEAERAAVRAQWLAGASVVRLLAGGRT
jgi:Transcription factor WhiB